jgi:predicted nucleotidyltransferase component of viral defense system
MDTSVAPIALSFTGFQSETAEKVRHLLVILNKIHEHPCLNGRVYLHGGTALNLFFLKVPRLSTDIDLNYIGSVDRAVMYEERSRVEQDIVDVGRELGFTVTSGTDEHSGRSFRFQYSTARRCPAHSQSRLR